MYSRALSIVLAASIVTCPLVCGAHGSCCETNSDASVHSCCAHHQAANPADTAHHDRGHSNRGPHGSDGCGPCVCKGAVVEQGPRDLQLDGVYQVACASP